MKKMISREERDAMIMSIPGLTAEDAVDAILAKVGVEVEEPAVLPGVTAGTWMPCCGHDADKGKYYIHANGVKIAEVYSPGDRTVMVASKELVKASVAVLNGKADPNKWNRLHEVLKEAGCREV